MTVNGSPPLSFVRLSAGSALRVSEEGARDSLQRSWKGGFSSPPFEDSDMVGGVESRGTVRLYVS